MRSPRLATYILSAVLTAICAAGAYSQSPDTSALQPRLGVVIVVDQMRPDYLTRFDKQYVGGFRRLLDQGAVFLNAIHDHAATETAVGHVTISTGCIPAHHGIIGNEYYDRIEKRNVYSMLDTLSPVIGSAVGKGSSPRRILMPTLGEYLKEYSPASKIYSMAIKDRSAIGMAGKKADGVFWFDRTKGNYITSTYYADSYPHWVDSFNAARQVDSYFETGWHKLLPDSAYALSSDDAVINENDAIHTSFPHLFTDFSKQPDKTYYDELYATPFLDHVTLSLAQTATRYASLGADSALDLLFISCSAADAAGHTYGPFSQEMQDFYLRLDQFLGEFFAHLDSTVGPDRYVIVLSSDHGALPLPEQLKRDGVDAGRIHPDKVKGEMLEVGRKLGEQLGLRGYPFLSTGWEVNLDYSLLAGSAIDSIELDSLARHALMQLPYVADVYAHSELADPKAPLRPHMQRFRNCYHPDRGSDLFVRFSENYLITSDSTGTSHGTAYDYDCIVPIVFSGPGVASGRHDDVIRTVDIAPTLAALLRIPISGKMDGSIIALALHL